MYSIQLPWYCAHIQSSPVLIDISRPISNDALVYPGDPRPRLEQLAAVPQDGYALSALSMSLHTATHLDAPAHFFDGAPGIADLPPERFCVNAAVISCGEAQCVTAEHVRTSGITEGEAILFRTGNSRLAWDSLPSAWVFISEEAARACVAAGAGIVGFDYLDVESPDGAATHPVHHLLLGNNVLILEGLDLSRVSPGRYRLYCFPLLIPGTEASPCRAVLELPG